MKHSPNVSVKGNKFIAAHENAEKFRRSKRHDEMFLCTANPSVFEVKSPRESNSPFQDHHNISGMQSITEADFMSTRPLRVV
jgi:hypothetical protein